LVVWTVAAAYRLLSGDAPPHKGRTFTWAVCIAFLMLAVPGDLGHRIQTMGVWKRDFPMLSNCQVATGSYIKEHSLPTDIVQDATNDPRFILSALSSRLPYAIDAGGGRPPKGLEERLRALGAVRSAATLNQAATLARQMGIQWWVIGPGANVAWRAEIGGRAAFKCDQYQVVRF
jgi:hypothetical protein